MCKSNTSTTSTSSPNATAMQAYQDLLGKAQGVAATPYQAYGGEMVAPVNEQQQLGIKGINQNAGFAQPFIDQAHGFATQAAAPITGSEIAQYQSPYTQQVVDATQAQFNSQNAKQQSALTGNAAAQGALGGDRVGVAQANLAGEQSRAQNPVIAGLYGQGYQNAEQMALAQRQNLGNAAYSIGNLGVAGQSAGLQGAGAQIGAGGLQQQTQQQLDAAKMQQFFQQQAYPFQTTQWLAGIDTGVGSQMGGTSQTTPPPPNPFGQVAGLGIAALGAFAKDGGRIRGFDGGGGIGGTPYAGVSGWVPTMQITGGSGAPKPPGMSGQQQGQQAGLGGIKAETDAMKGIKSLWNKYGSAGSPMDLTGGFGGFSPDGLGSMQEIGTSPELGFGMGALYRRGGGVRGYDEGGPVGLAGFGTGSMMPASLDERFYLPPHHVDPRAYNALQDAHAIGEDYDNTGHPAPHMADLPLPRPRPPQAGLGDVSADLPSEITRGESDRAPSIDMGGDDDTGVLAYGPGAQQAGFGGAGVQPEEGRDTETAAQGHGGLGNLLGLSPDVKRSLLAAGFGMLASRSPHFGNAIGEGGLSGLNTYSGLQKERRAEAKTQADIEHGRKQLEQQAKHYADQLALDTKKFETGQENRGTLDAAHKAQVEHQNAVLEEQKRQHQAALRAPVNLGADPRTGMPIMALPRFNKDGGLDYHLIGPNGQISDTPLGGGSAAPGPGPMSSIPSSPANASQPVRTAALDTGSVSDAPRPGEGIIQHNRRVAQSGAFDYGTDAPYVEKGLDVPEPAPLAGRSVQALKTDAEYFLQTGKLPPVVRGNSPVAIVQQRYQNAVKNYGNALAQSRGMNPTEVAEAWRTAPGMLRFVLGADGRSTVSLGTAVRHLDTIKQLADAWKEGSTVGNWQTWNRVTSSVRREFGDSAVTNLESAARIVGPEIIKALGVAGAGTEHDRNTAAGQFLTGQGFDQINGAIKTTQSLLGGQLEGRKRQAASAGVSEERFKSLIGDRPYELLTHIDKGPAAVASSPQSQEALDWANKNPNDPRAVAIKKKLGIQ